MCFSSISPFQIVPSALSCIDLMAENVPPWKVACYTAAFVATGTILATRWASRQSWNWETQIKSAARMIPSVQSKLQEETRKIEKSLEEKYFKDLDPKEVCEEIPSEAWEPERILARLESVSGDARSGKNTGAYYIDNEALDELILQVCRLARRTNPLHTDLSPLIRQLEAEIVRMTLTMFKGDAATVGNVTSGGTDSIRHAVFTSRERAKALGIGGGWEMVVPTTAHPAFAKAANEYGIKLVRTEVYPQPHSKAYQVKIDQMRRAITKYTILVVGSMPPYPHGIPDDIGAISNMLERVDSMKRIGLHVDCCLGGFVVPWMEDAGFGQDVKTKFGFDVARVTSISADTHKYGYGEKGTSVVMYRDHDNWRKHQIFVETEWPGGIYATPTLPGSRSGRDIAAMWAVMAFLGKKGYIEETKKIIEVTRMVTEIIRKDEDLNEYLEIMGSPKMMVVAVCSKKPDVVNIYDVKEEMKKLGWYLGGLQKPAGFHFCTTAVQGNDPGFAGEFIGDLKKAVEAVLSLPSAKKGKSGDAAMYCANEKMGESMFVPDVAKEFWNIAGRVKPLTLPGY